MSIVKMDMSEYEALKKVENLLEESLTNERILKQELIDAQEENIKALKENSKSVTIVEAVEVTEHTKVLRPASDIWRWLKDVVVRKETYGDLRLPFVASSTDDPFRDETDVLARAFFSTHTTKSYNEKLVTRKGFDDVIVEIRDEVRAEMNDDIKEKLATGRRIEAEYTKLLEKSNADAKVIKQLSKENAELDQMYHALLKSHEGVNLTLDEYRVIVKKVEKETNATSWFNAVKAIAAIKKHIKWKE